MRAIQLTGWLLPSLLRRYKAPLALAAAGVAVFGLLLPLIGSTAEEASSSDAGLGAPVLRTVIISGYGPDATTSELTGRALEELARIEHVEAVDGWTQIGLTMLTAQTDPHFLNLTPRIAPVQPVVIAGSEPEVPGEIIIADTLANEAELSPGDPVIVESNRRIPGTQEGEGIDTEAVVVGVFDGSVVGVDGPDVAYGIADDVLAYVAQEQGVPLATLEASFGFPRAYVLVDDPQNLAAVVGELLATGYTAESLGSLLTRAPATQRFLNLMRPVTAGLLLVFLVVVAGATAGSVVAAKRSEVGLLRALGWSRREVTAAFNFQFLAMGAVVGISGATTSLLTLVVLRTGGEEITVFSVPLAVQLSVGVFSQLAALAIAPSLVFVLASVLPTRKLSRTPPDDVLRELNR